MFDPATGKFRTLQDPVSRSAGTATCCLTRLCSRRENREELVPDDSVFSHADLVCREVPRGDPARAFPSVRSSLRHTCSTAAMGSSRKNRESARTDSYGSPSDQDRGRAAEVGSVVSFAAITTPTA